VSRYSVSIVNKTISRIFLVKYILLMIPIIPYTIYIWYILPYIILSVTHFCKKHCICIPIFLKRSVINFQAPASRWKILRTPLVTKQYIILPHVQTNNKWHALQYYLLFIKFIFYFFSIFFNNLQYKLTYLIVFWNIYLI